MEMNTRDIILNNEESKNFLDQIHHPNKDSIRIRDAVFAEIDARISTKVDNGVIFAEIPDMDVALLSSILGNEDDVFKRCKSSAIYLDGECGFVSDVMITNNLGKCA